MTKKFTFFTMNTKDIEEIVEEFKILHCKQKHDVYFPATQTAEGQIDWLRTTLAKITQHHKAEVERAVAKERVDTLIQVTSWLLGRKDVDAAKELNEAMLKHFNITLTTPDKQTKT